MQCCYIVSKDIWATLLKVRPKVFYNSYSVFLTTWGAWNKIATITNDIHLLHLVSDIKQIAAYTSIRQNITLAFILVTRWLYLFTRFNSLPTRENLSLAAKFAIWSLTVLVWFLVLSKQSTDYWTVRMDVRILTIIPIILYWKKIYIFKTYLEYFLSWCPALIMTFLKNKSVSEVKKQFNRKGLYIFDIFFEYYRH